jgi:hypothetical protein
MMVITGEDAPFRDFYVFAWAGWIFLPAGVVICFLSIRAIRRGEGKVEPKTYTEEDVAKAKEALDRMYLKEHGKLPEEEEHKKDA